MDFSSLNKWLKDNGLFIKNNPCISPDFCLDLDKSWIMKPDLCRQYSASRFRTAIGEFAIVENEETGDCMWILSTDRDANVDFGGLEHGEKLAEHQYAFPCTFYNLLKMKNIVLEYDTGSTIFPKAVSPLDKSSLGIGARFTTLHWPAVDYAMSKLRLPLTANQNSIPRELIYSVKKMQDHQLEMVPFKFIGCSIPEGHQGTSVEGMSHGAVLEKLKHGFHLYRTPWGQNADHQPVGGPKWTIEEEEDALVHGSVLASYITFDLSPELLSRSFSAEVPSEVYEHVKDRLSNVNNEKEKEKEVQNVVETLWPSLVLLKRRDEKYRNIRKMFTTENGREFFTELSIDELPGLTSQLTLRIVLILCEYLKVKVHFIAPAFGFQKNFPFEDNVMLKERIESAWSVCKEFGVSIGFHSGSGKSAENYGICGQVTHGNLEIKTSGRYTYEMGRALSESKNESDHKLWLDWYNFTREIALESAYSEDEDESASARGFIMETFAENALAFEKKFKNKEECRIALNELTPSPDHMLWFEYNFLFVLAKSGSSKKADFGAHDVDGYLQRSRFYSISDESKLQYSKNVVEYICFLAKTTGLVNGDVADAAVKSVKLLSKYSDLYAKENDNGIVLNCIVPEPKKVSFFNSISLPLPVSNPNPGLDVDMVKVKVHRVGICGTDYKAFVGKQPFFSYPRILGHELAVQVVGGESGGQKCAIRPYIPCFKCVACKNGKPNCCEAISVIGVHSDGGMRSELCLPRHCLHPSKVLDYDQLALVETVAIGAHGVRRANVKPDESILILGCGPIGIGIAQCCSIAGAKNVLLFDVEMKRLNFVESMNLSPNISILKSESSTSKSTAISESVIRAMNGGELVDVVFDATGNAGSMNSAFKWARHGGRVVFVGLHLGDVCFPDPLFHAKELTLLSSRNATSDDFEFVIKCMESGQLNVTKWITHRCTLVDVENALRNWMNEGVFKGIVEIAR